jgi:hypothetical protein
MQLHSIQDPRDNLEKARRMELLRFAQENGVTEIVEAMPAIVMRQILRAKRLTRISIPNRTLGSAPVPEPQVSSSSVSVDAAADLAQQWKREAEAPPPAPPRKRRGRPPKVKQDGKDTA